MWDKSRWTTAYPGQSYGEKQYRPRCSARYSWCLPPGAHSSCGPSLSPAQRSRAGDRRCLPLTRPSDLAKGGKGANVPPRNLTKHPRPRIESFNAHHDSAGLVVYCASQSQTSLLIITTRPGHPRTFQPKASWLSSRLGSGVHDDMILFN